MSYLNSCNICYRPFKDNYTIWNATSIKNNKIFNNKRDALESNKLIF